MLSLSLMACDGKVPETGDNTNWQAESGDRQLALVELFTSEGCGLCPAADTWVSQLPEQGLDDQNLVILGFHIDYLNDKKGWIDPFGKARFADRQRELAQLNLLQSIFTPEFVVSGEVVHLWRENIPRMINKLNEMPPEATISLQANKDENTLHMTAQVEVSGKDNRSYAKLYLAITEDNIISRAEDGDNTGHTFHHQNLVREWLGPFELDVDGETELTQQVTIDPEWKQADLSLVAVVQNVDDSFVLQSLALPLN